MMDPRLDHIDKALSGVGRIIAVVSGKGGVGKSVTSATMALQLARSGRRVGLLDLDFQSPCLHLILGARGEKPVEDRGLVPPVVAGVRLMSIVYFSEDRPVALKGVEVSDVLIELLAVTRWGELEFLIIDAPPGIGDELLDLVRLVRRAEFLAVTTPSPLAMSSASKVLKVLQDSGSRILGVIVNMVMGEEKTACKCLGSIPFDPELEKSIGSPERILGTAFSRGLRKIVNGLIAVR